MNQSYLRRWQTERGSLVLTAAISAAVIAILIGGMLTFISNEYTLNVRSHRWTQALNLAEAGVELGFAEFNDYYIKGLNSFGSSRGWYNNGAGSYYCYIPSFINGSGDNVGVIYSYVNGVGTAHPYLFAYGGCNTTPRGPVVYRAVECTLTFNAQFPAGMVAKGSIDMKGNPITTDSYDSGDVSKSTGGRYDSGKKQPHGDIATNDAIINSIINVGNADIYGSVMTGPSGSVSMGSNGSIGPTFSNPATTVAAAQANGWVRNDFAVDIPDVTLPTAAASWTWLGGIDSLGNQTLASGDYKASEINLKNSQELVIDGNVRIYVTGNTDIGGSAQIVVNPGASLVIYSAGSLDIGGNGMVNSSSTAMSVQFYGLNTCTSANLHGNANWCGILYAPYASLTLGGGGSSGDMSGSVVAQTIWLNGQVTFHYDEALRKTGPNSSYNIASWKSYRWTGYGGWVSD